MLDVATAAAATAAAADADDDVAAFVEFACV